MAAKSPRPGSRHYHVRQCFEQRRSPKSDRLPQDLAGRREPAAHRHAVSTIDAKLDGDFTMTTIRINGIDRKVDGDPQIPLLWAIRDILGLTGTKFGCGIGACGACTVHLDDQAVRSCITPLSAAEGHEIVTIEGLSPDGTHLVQRAWQTNNVPQCGYCQP